MTRSQLIQGGVPRLTSMSLFNESTNKHQSWLAWNSIEWNKIELTKVILCRSSCNQLVVLNQSTDINMMPHLSNLNLREEYLKR